MRSALAPIVLPDRRSLAEPRLPSPTLRLVGCLLLAAALLPLPTRAEEAVTPYRVAPGDRISILVLGQAELSGEMMIDGAYAVTVPLIGRVSVRGLDLDGIEQRIAARLADGYVKSPVVSVRLTEPRPLYIVGDVKTPGSYPYRSGVSVIAAVALAGGFLISEEQAQAVLRNDFIQADERVQTLEAQRLAQMAKRARLEAQRDERAEIDFGSVRSATGSDNPIAELIEGETALHIFQLNSLRQQIDLLSQQEPKFTAEIAFLEAQTAAEKRQLELVHQQLTDFNTLMETGFARKFTGIELQRDEARYQGNIAQLAGEMTRIQLSIGEMKLRILDIQDGFQRRVRSELQETLQSLAVIDASLPAARATRELRLRQVGFVAEVAGPPRRSLFVTRSINDQTQTLAVTETTELEPGDILRIERRSEPDQTAQSSPKPQNADGRLAAKDIN